MICFLRHCFAVGLSTCQYVWIKIWLIIHKSYLRVNYPWLTFCIFAFSTLFPRTFFVSYLHNRRFPYRTKYLLKCKLFVFGSFHYQKRRLNFSNFHYFQMFARFYFLESLGYLKIQRKWDSFLHFRWFFKWNYYLNRSSIYRQKSRNMQAFCTKSHFFHAI